MLTGVTWVDKALAGMTMCGGCAGPACCVMVRSQRNPYVKRGHSFVAHPACLRCAELTAAATRP